MIDLDALDKAWGEGPNWSEIIGSQWPEVSAELRAARKVVEASKKYTNNLGQHHYWRCCATRNGTRDEPCDCGGRETWDAIAAYDSEARK